MVGIRDEETITIPELKWSLDAFTNFGRLYDKQRDILFLHQIPRRSALSLDVGGHYWLRFDPETGEVVGVEIEDFERVFLARYPELQAGWQDVKPKIIKPFKRNTTRFEEYLRLLYIWLRDTLKTHPVQLSLPPVQPSP